MRFISFLFPRSPLLIFGKVSSAGEREGEGDYAPSPLFPRPGISPSPLPLAWSQRRNRHHDDRLSTHNLRMPKKSSSPPRGKKSPSVTAASSTPPSRFWAEERPKRHAYAHTICKHSVVSSPPPPPSVWQRRRRALRPQRRSPPPPLSAHKTRTHVRLIFPSRQHLDSRNLLCRYIHSPPPRPGKKVSLGPSVALGLTVCEVSLPHVQVGWKARKKPFCRVHSACRVNPLCFFCV